MKNSRDRVLDATFDEVYKYGYSGTSISEIVKIANTPKGSIYHHFASKKEMVLAMIKERLIPKVREFFDFKMQKDSTALDILNYTTKKMANNPTLIKYGCPLHRLMFEMDMQDKDIAKACLDEFLYLRDDLARVLEFGMREGSIKEVDSRQLAEYIITSTWGFLSRPSKLSSKEQFLKDYHILIDGIKS